MHKLKLTYHMYMQTDTPNVPKYMLVYMLINECKYLQRMAQGF